jgi:hypothetical protein
MVGAIAGDRVSHRQRADRHPAALADARGGGAAEANMTTAPVHARVTPSGRSPTLPLLLLAGAIFGCSIYANLSAVVVNKADYRYFPPFKPYVNANENRNLGGEYFNIARALTAGDGYAHPFVRPTGPTAWQPPVLPLVLAGLLWVADGDRDIVMAVVVLLQMLILVGTGALVLALVQRSTRCIRPGVAAAVFFAALLADFHAWFQETEDYWLVLLCVDLVVAGLCWLRPLDRPGTAAGWGLFGGLCAMVNPIVGSVWGVMSLVVGRRHGARSRLVIAVLMAGLTLAPWTIRNYLVFGRWIPTKSNLMYELYQSHCMQADGLLQHKTFTKHPYSSQTREWEEYNTLGEVAYMDRKSEKFLAAVAADPVDFLERVAWRFLGVTLWFTPLDRQAAARRPWVLAANRVLHPLPFLGLGILLISSLWQPLRWSQWAVIGTYVFYLLPYVVISYYDRYAWPLVGVKVLLVLWATDRLLRGFQSRVRSRSTATARRSSRPASRRSKS